MKFGILLLLSAAILSTGAFAQPRTVEEPPRDGTGPGKISTAQTSETVAPVELSWQTVDCGNFKVKIPGKPVHSLASIDAGYGPTEKITYESETMYGTFIVTYLDEPSEVGDAAKQKLTFDQVEAGARKRGNAVMRSRDIRIGEYYGRDFIITLPRSGSLMTTTIAMRLAIFGKRLVQLSVARSTPLVDPMDKMAIALKYRDKFFDSLSAVESSARPDLK